MKRRSKKDRPGLVPEIFAQQPSFTDPQGSWTGLPMNEHELPVQDVDDLEKIPLLHTGEGGFCVLKSQNRRLSRRLA